MRLRRRLLKVAFDLVRGPGLGVVRALPRGPARTPLTEQVPALVEPLFEGAQPLVLLVGGQPAEQVRDGVRHQMWPNGKQPRVELWTLPHLPHGYPVGSRLVAPGHFVEQAPVDATASIARFFGLD